MAKVQVHLMALRLTQVVAFISQTMSTMPFTALQIQFQL